MDAATPGSHTATGRTSDRSLVIRNLYKEYRAGEPVLKNISLEVAGHGVTAVIGPSGTGKSTLVRCINRLVEPTSGEILFRGQDLVTLAPTELRLARRRIGMIFQEYNLVERLSVIENVLCAGSAMCRRGGHGCASSPRPMWNARSNSLMRSGSAPWQRSAPTSCRAGNGSASASHAR